MCHKDPPRKLCILYEEEVPFAGLSLPFRFQFSVILKAWPFS